MQSPRRKSSARARPRLGCGVDVRPLAQALEFSHERDVDREAMWWRATREERQGKCARHGCGETMSLAGSAEAVVTGSARTSRSEENAPICASLRCRKTHGQRWSLRLLVTDDALLSHRLNAFQPHVVSVLSIARSTRVGRITPSSRTQRWGVASRSQWAWRVPGKTRPARARRP